MLYQTRFDLCQLARLSSKQDGSSSLSKQILLHLYHTYITFISSDLSILSQSIPQPGMRTLIRGIIIP